MVEPVYTTRENVKRSLDIAETSRSNTIIDRHIRAASRDVEGLCHRRFYPQTATRYFDWPNNQGAPAWQLWLEDSELISITTLSSGGTTIASTGYLLEPNRTGPPYNQLSINIGTSASFGGGSTYQRDITVTGLWGYTNDETDIGTVVEALDATETGIDVSSAASAAIGVGSIIRIDSERMQVTGRTQITTGQTLSTSLTAAQNIVTVAVPDGTQFTVDEVILLDSERMLIVDISGNNLTVIRGWDGTVLAAHTSGITIYAQRTLTVSRGALGTTAATHTTATAINLWNPPSGIEEYTTAFAHSNLMQEKTGWFRTMSASSNFGGTARRSASMESLMDLQTRVYRQYGRKARTRTV